MSHLEMYTKVRWFPLYCLVGSELLFLGWHIPVSSPSRCAPFRRLLLHIHQFNEGGKKKKRERRRKKKNSSIMRNGIMKFSRKFLLTCILSAAIDIFSCNLMYKDFVSSYSCFCEHFLYVLFWFWKLSITHLNKHN